MEKRKQYSISELVKELNTPRSTVNDWLSKYSQYIDFEFQGKRKVFFDTSLNVLKEISELRDSGQSSHEIGQSLAERHPLQAEVAAVPEAKTPEPENDNMPVRNDAEELLPALRRQTEEFGRLLGTRLEDISKHLENSNQQNLSSIKRARFWSLAALLLLLALCVGLAVGAVKLNQAFKEQRDQIISNRDKLVGQNKTLAGELIKNKNTITQQNEKLEKLTVILDRNSADYVKNVERLQKDMKEQRQKFDTMLDTVKQDAEKQKTAELAIQKNEFAKRQLEQLKQLEQMSASLKAKEKEINELNKQLLQSNEAVKKLSTATEDVRKQQAELKKQTELILKQMSPKSKAKQKGNE